MSRTSATRAVTRSEIEERLRANFANKKALNWRFSVKAYANQLGIHESTLDKILKGQRKIGVHVARAIAPALGVVLSPEDPMTRRKADHPSDRATAIAPHLFDSLGWIHFAILESMKLSDFQPKESWVATRFGLSLGETRKILGQMKLAGVLKRSGATWLDTLEDAVSAGAGAMSTASMRENQRDFLAFSAQQIERIPIDRREHFLFVFPVDDVEIARLKKKSRKFLIDAAEQCQKSRRPKKAIYGMHIGLVPLTTLGDSK